jgi:hypothetical protein
MTRRAVSGPAPIRCARLSVNAAIVRLASATCEGRAPHCGALETYLVRVTWDGVLALIGCLVVAALPLPRRAEGLRVGLFGAVMGYLLFDAMKRASDSDVAPEPVRVGAAETGERKADGTRDIVQDLSSENEDERLTASDVLTDFSILRHLRRIGAVSDAEFDAKKVHILRRV